MSDKDTQGVFSRCDCGNMVWRFQNRTGQGFPNFDGPLLMQSGAEQEGKQAYTNLYLARIGMRLCSRTHIGPRKTLFPEVSQLYKELWYSWAANLLLEKPCAAKSHDPSSH